jgi:hypothetical protein
MDKTRKEIIDLLGQAGYSVNGKAYEITNSDRFVVGVLGEDCVVRPHYDYQEPECLSAVLDLKDEAIVRGIPCSVRGLKSARDLLVNQMRTISQLESRLRAIA